MGEGAVNARLVNRLSNKILHRAEEICETEAYLLEDAEAIIVAYGFVARAGLRAVRELRAEGIRVGLLRLKTLWPFPEKAVREAAERCGRFLVPEMNLGQVIREVQRVACTARIEGLNQIDGEPIFPQKIAAAAKRVLS